MPATRAAAVACLGPKAGQMVDEDLNNLAVAGCAAVPGVKMVDDPVPPAKTLPTPCLSFEGKMIKRLCGQGFLFRTLKAGWESTILWFESRDMSNQNVKEMIRVIQYWEVYSFKDVVDFTPWVHTRKSNVALYIYIYQTTTMMTMYTVFISQGSSYRL